jgi:cyclase
MIKKRIIPKILLFPSQNSKKIIAGTSIKYEIQRPTGLPESQAQIYQSTISDELMILVSNKHAFNNSEIIETLKQINECILMPLSFGGNLNQLENVEEIIDLGVEKIIFNRAQFDNPNTISKVAKKYGSQSVVVSLDFIKTDDEEIVAVKVSGTYKKIPLKVLLSNIENLGAGEICLNNTSRDGTFVGTDLVTLGIVRDLTDLPLIQSCGVGKVNHFAEAFHHGADAVAAGSYFSFMDQNILQIRSHVSNFGINIRY